MPSPDEYRSLDLEGAAQSGVARSSNVLGNTALIAFRSRRSPLLGGCSTRGNTKTPS
jgi:hypothetical protein